jgi:hypothetical protein
VNTKQVLVTGAATASPALATATAAAMIANNASKCINDELPSRPSQHVFSPVSPPPQLSQQQHQLGIVSPSSPESTSSQSDNEGVSSSQLSTAPSPATDHDRVPAYYAQQPVSFLPLMPPASGSRLKHGRDPSKAQPQPQGLTGMTTRSASRSPVRKRDRRLDSSDSALALWNPTALTTVVPKSLVAVFDESIVVRMAMKQLMPWLKKAINANVSPHAHE